jgi:hypothetical protein
VFSNWEKIPTAGLCVGSLKTAVAVSFVHVPIVNDGRRGLAKRLMTGELELSALSIHHSLSSTHPRNISAVHPRSCIRIFLKSFDSFCPLISLRGMVP